MIIVHLFLHQLKWHCRHYYRDENSLFQHILTAQNTAWHYANASSWWLSTEETHSAPLTSPLRRRYGYLCSESYQRHMTPHYADITPLIITIRAICCSKALHHLRRILVGLMSNIGNGYADAQVTHTHMSTSMMVERKMTFFIVFLWRIYATRYAARPIAYRRPPDIDSAISWFEPFISCHDAPPASFHRPDTTIAQSFARSRLHEIKWDFPRLHIERNFLRADK